MHREVGQKIKDTKTESREVGRYLKERLAKHLGKTTRYSIFGRKEQGGKLMRV